MRDLRWTRRQLAPVTLLALLPGLAWPVRAQIVRTFPKDTEEGRITFDAPPQVRVNGQRERLGPGVQVRAEDNRVPRWDRLRGQTVTARFQRDASGAIFRIWLPSAKERQQPRQGQPPRPVQDRRASGYIN